MIYVKKTDGTIEQYADGMMSALQIDKELYRQQGKDFGEIYTADSLPDENKIDQRLISQADYIAKLKAQALAVVSQRSYSERSVILDDMTISNIAIGAVSGYPAYLTAANVASMIEQFKSIAKQAKTNITKAKTKADIDSILEALAFPSEEQILAEISGGS